MRHRGPGGGIRPETRMGGPHTLRHEDGRNTPRPHETDDRPHAHLPDRHRTHRQRGTGERHARRSAGDHLEGIRHRIPHPENLFDE